MKILIRGQHDRQWHLVASAAYTNEKTLQSLLGESPSIISIDEIRPEAGPLVAAIPEVTLPIGSVDLLAFTAEGDIAIIECKLASNAEVKRKVIGQILEYAANVWEMRYEQLDEIVRLRKGVSLIELMRSSIAASEEWDEENFRKNIESALESGRFILIIVVDEINDELSRIVRFLNACGSTNYEFAALEMRRFTAEKAEMLVPRVFGPSKVVRSTSGSGPRHQWDEATFFAELQKNHDNQVVTVARNILKWAKQAAEVWYGKGSRNGSFVPHFYHKERDHQIFVVWTNGYLETYFQWYAYKPPFDSMEKRIELAQKLNQIDGVNIPLDMLDRRPSFPLSTLVKEGNLDRLLEVYDWYIAEVKKS